MAMSSLTSDTLEETKWMLGIQTIMHVPILAPYR